MNSYYNEQIDFYIEKPDSWEFLPTEWAMNIRNKTALSNDEAYFMMLQANAPFVYMRKLLSRSDIAYPTVQATCRPTNVSSREERKRLLRLQVTNFENSFANFDLIDSTVDNEISDCPSNYIKGAFSIKNQEGRVLNCLSQSWCIFYAGIGYTVGLSGSLENSIEYEDEFTQILSTILIGKKA